MDEHQELTDIQKKRFFVILFAICVVLIILAIWVF